jgi:hypothetical protein
MKVIKITQTKNIEFCRLCPERSGYLCNKKGGMTIPDIYTIPDWCPLPDAKKDNK